MTLIPQHDRLIHILLKEALGGQTPPDLTDRVVRRVFVAPRGRRRWMIPAAAAAAAVILAAGAWLAQGLWGYPAPAVSGDYRIESGSLSQRGVTLGTGSGHADVVLGGYCRLDIGPSSRVRLQGRKRAEEIYLEKGFATCEVDRNIGTFSVQTEVGTVSVTGTKFSVRILENEGDDEMLPKRMVVKVLVGAVMLTGAWGNVAVMAGQEKTVAATPMAETTKVTITGMAKALGDPSAKMDPTVANATVTTSDNTVYYVYGWAGVIVAKNDGKKVEVNGYVGEKDGKKTITGKSIDVKVIVVE